jgi:cyclase
VVVGQRGALVIDAGINPAMAHQIQETVRRLTDRPILWLANTVYHGDHTFGNAAFPATTKIIASRQTAQSMTDLDAEKQARGQNLRGNLDAIAEVTSWRRPDVVFDDHTEVDLGGRTGNSPGDTVVWVPEARAAWTGNLLGHRRVAPMLLEGGPAPYIDTLARFKSTLDVRTVVPGHGPLADARALDTWMAYLRQPRRRLKGIGGSRPCSVGRRPRSGVPGSAPPGAPRPGSPPAPRAGAAAARRCRQPARLPGSRRSRPGTSGSC